MVKIDPLYLEYEVLGEPDMSMPYGGLNPEELLAHVVDDGLLKLGSQSMLYLASESCNRVRVQLIAHGRRRFFLGSPSGAHRWAWKLILRMTASKAAKALVAGKHYAVEEQ